MRKRNWNQYNQELVKRRSITFFINKKALTQKLKENKRGRPRLFFNPLIHMLLILKSTQPSTPKHEKLSSQREPIDIGPTALSVLKSYKNFPGAQKLFQVMEGMIPKTAERQFETLERQTSFHQEKAAVYQISAGETKPLQK